MNLKINDQAPDFALYNTELKITSLDDFKGKKVILHFFPMAFTGTCTQQLCTMRDDFGYYSNLNAQILGVSVDSPFTLAKFKEVNNYPFPLLSDFNKQVAQAYGAWYDEFVLGLKGVAKRAAFVIDEKGCILYKEILENAQDLPNFDRINQAINN